MVNLNINGWSLEGTTTNSSNKNNNGGGKVMAEETIAMKTPPITTPDSIMNLSSIKDDGGLEIDDDDDDDDDDVDNSALGLKIRTITLTPPRVTGNKSNNDNPLLMNDHDMERTVSDLTYPQDPPGLMMGSTSFKVNKGAAKQTNNSKTDNNNDDSIVAKMLTMVDLSCVSSGLVPQPDSPIPVHDNKKQIERTTAAVAVTNTSLSASNSGSSGSGGKNNNYNNNNNSQDTSSSSNNAARKKLNYSTQWGLPPEEENDDDEDNVGEEKKQDDPSSIDYQTLRGARTTSSVKLGLASIAAAVTESPSRKAHENFELVYKEKEKDNNTISSTHSEKKFKRLTHWVNKKIIARKTRSMDNNNNNNTITKLYTTDTDDDNDFDFITTTTTTNKSSSPVKQHEKNNSYHNNNYNETDTSISPNNSDTTSSSSGGGGNNNDENNNKRHNNNNNHIKGVLPKPGLFLRKNRSKKKNDAALFDNNNNNRSNNGATTTIPKRNKKRGGSGNGQQKQSLTNNKLKRETKILRSIKGSVPLETVQEESSSMASHESYANNNNFKVRVPGVQTKDSFISDKDLIGEEVVEEIYTSIEQSIAQEVVKTQVNYNTSTTVTTNPILSKSSNNNAGVVNKTVIDDTPSMIPTISLTNSKDGYLEFKDIHEEEEEEEDLIPKQAMTTTRNSKAHQKQDDVDMSSIQRSKSWRERFGFKKSSSTDSQEAQIRFVKSSKSTETEKTSKTPEEKNKKKPVWKAVVDPATGRTYYYHKKTRATTWQKPPDEDIIPTKPKVSGENQQQQQQNKKNNEETKQEEESQDDDVLNQSADDIKITYSEHNQSPVRSPDRSSSQGDDTRKEIERMLNSMSTSRTGGRSVDSVMSQYEGREDELLSQLKDLSESHRPHDESRPFDEEPIISDDKTKSSNDERGLTMTRSQTGVTTLQSGLSEKISARSRISEKTEQIKNTSSEKPKFSVIDQIRSSSNQSIGHYNTSKMKDSSVKVPKNIPVPRLRELNVEEFTLSDRMDRINRRQATTTTTAGGAPHHNPKEAQKPPHHHQTHKQPFAHAPDANYMGDNEETDGDRSTVSYAATDSISALSEADLSSLVDIKNIYKDARRRALDRAIAQEDWDLAAQLSQGMRNRGNPGNNNTVSTPNREVPGVWVQSEMDKFIAENDWDAVSAYIARLRANAMEAERAKINEHLGLKERQMTNTKKANVSTNPPKSSSNKKVAATAVVAAATASTITTDSNPQKRFGARSQLQHRDLRSVDSYSSGYSSTYDSEYSSASYASERRRAMKATTKNNNRSSTVRPASQPKRPKEFVC